MIELEFNLNEEDHLNLQLYAASQNPLIKKQRKRRAFLISGLFVLFGIVSFYSLSSYAGCIYIVLGVIFFILYPFYSTWLYKRHFKRHVKQYYDQAASNHISMKIDDENIMTYDAKGESTIKIKSLIEIIEISDYFYLQLSKAAYHVIPKKKINSVELLRQHLIKCANAYNIPVTIDLNWKWK
ncbi:Ca2+/Na+ antiporter [Dysgonomonas sp. PFB1-18]|uniref:YcxB family protein n=1 Tax=unclassified Dysgonomonas TaxID=2630389 RepID=UPI0024760738|nr:MULTISPECIES: YcxB family protein [unclassified Dysgonomonas]MDH6310810.1 Ca2+/Na+ antiporter [Dysgonomonas sp. PF1-14]MDH6340660.1 Ca2+/Na+ antiporter [Dysgonomonas sp. PF1-16]MDH6382233.1 Ca2+/Na+ antiporter [Dysgonomonas sp. PFB1-18]MDH6399630.1 Ca2+/Na+ antiporter [Dysgonomonas sp. PF1-23]